MENGFTYMCEMTTFKSNLLDTRTKSSFFDTIVLVTLESLSFEMSYKGYLFSFSFFLLVG